MCIIVIQWMVNMKTCIACKKYYSLWQAFAKSRCLSMCTRYLLVWLGLQLNVLSPSQAKLIMSTELCCNVLSVKHADARTLTVAAAVRLFEVSLPIHFPHHWIRTLCFICTVGRVSKCSFNSSSPCIILFPPSCMHKCCWLLKTLPCYLPWSHWCQPHFHSQIYPSFLLAYISPTISQSGTSCYTGPGATQPGQSSITCRWMQESSCSVGANTGWPWTGGPSYDKGCKQKVVVKLQQASCWGAELHTSHCASKETSNSRYLCWSFITRCEFFFRWSNCCSNQVTQAPAAHKVWMVPRDTIDHMSGYYILRSHTVNQHGTNLVETGASIHSYSCFTHRTYGF